MVSCSDKPRLNDEQRRLAADNLRLAGFALGLVKDSAAVQAGLRRGVTWDELTAEAYFALVKAAAHYDPARGAFTTYAVRCVHGAVFRYLAQSRNRPCGERWPAGADATAPECELVERRDVAERVRAELERLPPRWRDAVSERFGLDTGEGRTFEQMAQRRGVTKSAAQQQVGRGLTELRGRLCP